eukprot:1650689-Rhodomonas_salina.1
MGNTFIKQPHKRDVLGADFHSAGLITAAVSHQLRSIAQPRAKSKLCLPGRSKLSPLLDTCLPCSSCLNLLRPSTSKTKSVLVQSLLSGPEAKNTKVERKTTRGRQCIAVGSVSSCVPLAMHIPYTLSTRVHTRAHAHAHAHAHTHLPALTPPLPLQPRTPTTPPSSNTTSTSLRVVCDLVTGLLRGVTDAS